MVSVIYLPVVLEERGGQPQGCTPFGLENQPALTRSGDRHDGIQIEPSEPFGYDRASIISGSRSSNLKLREDRLAGTMSTQVWSPSHRASVPPPPPWDDRSLCRQDSVSNVSGICQFGWNHRTLYVFIDNGTDCQKERRNRIPTYHIIPPCRPMLLWGRREE